MSQDITKACITPGCGKPQKYKGICPSCYGVARKLIDANKTTWDQLCELGMVETEKKPFEVVFLEVLHQPVCGEHVETENGLVRLADGDTAVRPAPAPLDHRLFAAGIRPRI